MLYYTQSSLEFKQKAPYLFLSLSLSLSLSLLHTWIACEQCLSEMHGFSGRILTLKGYCHLLIDYFLCFSTLSLTLSTQASWWADIWTLCSPGIMLYSPSLYTIPILYPVYFILYSLYFILYSLYFILYSLFFILYPLYLILYPAFSSAIT